MVGRHHPNELYLYNVLRKWWEQTHQEQGYPFIRPLYFDLDKLPHDHDPTPEELLKHHYFWLSDHSRFWYYKEEDGDFAQLPALLLTDTGQLFGLQKRWYVSKIFETGLVRSATSGFEKFPLKIPNFTIFFPVGSKKSNLIRSKNSRVKDGLASCLLRVKINTKDMKGS